MIKRPRKRPTAAASAHLKLRNENNYENRQLMQQQIMDFGEESTLQLARTKRERRQIETMAAIMGDEGTDLGFMHSAFCMVSLPARKPKDDARVWHKRNGFVALTINSPVIYMPDGSCHDPGIPYGPRARLILMYLQSEAVRTKEPRIHMGDNLSQWMRSVGIEHITGGRKGSITQTYEQAKRLSFSTFSLTWKKDDGSGYGVIPNKTIISQFDLWKSGDPNQRVLWPSVMELTPEFFNDLREHAVPFPQEAIRQIKSSALAIDLYIWLVYRLRRLEKNLLVSWKDLHAHLGSQYHEVRFFKRSAIEALTLALAAYPDARVEPLEAGLLLKPSRSAIPSIPTAALISRR